jgi:hypothetical protein
LGLDVDKGGIALEDDDRGGDGNPRRREYSELARECFEFWLRGRVGSGGVSRLADDVARRRVPGFSAATAAATAALIAWIMLASRANLKSLSRKSNDINMKHPGRGGPARAVMTESLICI